MSSGDVSKGEMFKRLASQMKVPAPEELKLLMIKQSNERLRAEVSTMDVSEARRLLIPSYPEDITITMKTVINREADGLIRSFISGALPYLPWPEHILGPSPQPLSEICEESYHMTLRLRTFLKQ